MFSNLEIEICKGQVNSITIESDGTINGTNKIYRNGDLYTFTENIVGFIKIEKDDIIVDGSRFSLQVTNGNIDEIAGIEISNQKNVTIKRLSIIGVEHKDNAIQISEAQNIKIENCEFTGIRRGIYISNSQNIRLTQNKIIDLAWSGIHMYKCTDVFIIDNNISGNTDFLTSRGLHIGHSEIAMISQNNVSYCNYGIELNSCFQTTFSNNYFMKNYVGVYIFYGGNNMVTQNTIIDNERFGMELSSSTNNPGNTIHHNNFINNNMENISEELQVSNRWFAGPESNTWDNGKEGNYWSDYKIRYPTAEEVNSSGVYDIAFFINPENVDNYPLVEPWIPDVNEPSVSILSPENSTYTTKDIPLTFLVSNSSIWYGYILDGQETISISGNSTLSGISAGSHSLIVMAKDEIENIGFSEAMYFSVTEPFPIIITVVSIAIVGIITLGIIIYFKKYRK